MIISKVLLFIFCIGVVIAGLKLMNVIIERW